MAYSTSNHTSQQNSDHKTSVIAGGHPLFDDLPMCCLIATTTPPKTHVCLLFKCFPVAICHIRSAKIKLSLYLVNQARLEDVQE